MQFRFAKINLPLALFTILSLCTAKFATAQLQENELQNALGAKKFAFIVTHESHGDFAIGSYYLQMIGDSLSTVLPYYGRSNSATYSTDDNGINVQSKDFIYQANLLKNGSYNVRISLKHDRLTSSFSLHVNKNGNATLVANGINRENSVYTGVIQNL